MTLQNGTYNFVVLWSSYYAYACKAVLPFRLQTNQKLTINTNNVLEMNDYPGAQVCIYTNDPAFANQISEVNVTLSNI